MFYSVNIFDNDKINKIRLKYMSWENVFEDKNILFSAICDLLLNEENLLYYASQKESTKTLDDTRKYVKNLLDNNSYNSCMDDILNCIGWNENVDIYNNIFQGDLAEYLMNILLDKITSIDTIISKVSLKTSSKMPVYGNDNYFYDYDNGILYFGESKFYSDLKKALKEGINSILEHSKYEEISFVRNHTTSFIAETGEKRTMLVEKFESIYMEDIQKKSIIFIVNDDVYKKEDYEEKMLEYFATIEKINEISEEILFVFLPILSKEQFLKYFRERLKDYGKK